jgi:hypothetical protein
MQLEDATEEHGEALEEQRRGIDHEGAVVRERRVELAEVCGDRGGHDAPNIERAQDEMDAHAPNNGPPAGTIEYGPAPRCQSYHWGPAPNASRAFSVPSPYPMRTTSGTTGHQSLRPYSAVLQKWLRRKCTALLEQRFAVRYRYRNGGQYRVAEESQLRPISEHIVSSAIAAGRTGGSDARISMGIALLMAPPFVRMTQGQGPGRDRDMSADVMRPEPSKLVSNRGSVTVRLSTESAAVSSEQCSMSDATGCDSQHEGRGTRDEGRGTRDEGRGTPTVVLYGTVGQGQCPRCAALFSAAGYIAHKHSILRSLVAMLPL